MRRCIGAAKDAMNMAGFVAANVRRGDVEIVHAEQFTPEGLEKWVVLDARSPGEFASGHLKGAVLVLVDELRGRLGELNRGKKVLVYRQVGYRGVILRIAY
jgi:rhodanese-related sulfurtransferase